MRMFVPGSAVGVVVTMSMPIMGTKTGRCSARVNRK